VKGELLPTGKLNVRILRKLLKRYATIDERVLLGPAIGEDAAAIEMGDRVLIVATDPITFATSEIGYYSVMVNANDVATSGAEPKWYAVTILLPEAEATEGLVDSIFEQIHRACEKLDVFLIGGHTEITQGLDRPLLVGQMMGEVQKGSLVTTAGGIPQDLIERAQRFLFAPGIGVVQEALLACKAGRVHAMHDPTEGGLANGLYELAVAAGVEIEVEMERVAVYDESRIVCKAFGLDPMGVIASGALLITAPPTESEKILERADQDGVVMARIGRVKAAGSPSVTMLSSQGSKPLAYFDRDELVKIL
jgi:hydrogenase maturation factor